MQTSFNPSAPNVIATEGFTDEGIAQIISASTPRHSATFGYFGYPP
jgi:hypothetical protein